MTATNFNSSISCYTHVSLTITFIIWKYHKLVAEQLIGTRLSGPNHMMPDDHNFHQEDYEHHPDDEKNTEIHFLSPHQNLSRWSQGIWMTILIGQCMLRGRGGYKRPKFLTGNHYFLGFMLITWTWSQGPTTGMIPICTTCLSSANVRRTVGLRG